MAHGFRIVVVGATLSTLRIAQGLVRSGAHLVGVLSLDYSAASMVSGFSTAKISSFCQEKGIPFKTFIQVNDPATISSIRSLVPDVLFAVGFSQLIGEEILAIPTRGTVGFHPTLLPRGRGRAPLAWLTYDAADGAATFFIMGKGIDDGPILAQEPFTASSNDHAGDVNDKILAAIDRALDRWVPDLIKGEWYAIPQDESLATYTGIRRPADGLIDWGEPWQVTCARIRAASSPHPGAYTYADDRKIIIWKVEPANVMPWRGVPGRILLLCKKRGALVQAGDGLLWLRDIKDAQDPQSPVKLRVGQRLGYTIQDEIFKLKNEISILKEKLLKDQTVS